MFKIFIYCPNQYGSVGWASSCKAKGHQFNSQPGHMPGFCPPYDRQLIDVSHIYASLPLFLPLFPSLKVINKF